MATKGLNLGTGYQSLEPLYGASKALNRCTGVPKFDKLYWGDKFGTLHWAAKAWNRCSGVPKFGTVVIGCQSLDRLYKCEKD